MSKAALVAATAPNLVNKLSAQRTPEKIRLGLVGCGNRGTGAAMDAIQSVPNVELVAIADLFPDKLQRSLGLLRKPRKGRERTFAAEYGNLVIDWDRYDAIKVTPERTFVGWNAYQEILQTDADIIILATPPAFRPQHIRACLEAGKHVFAEKPVAVDPVGSRSVFESVKLAEKKKLGFMGGTQLRFSESYNEIIKRIQDGQIGKVLSAECYWWHDFFVKAHAEKRKPEWSDVEFQIRAWSQFYYLSGDHIVENLVHNIDVMNWIMGGPPKSATAQGGHINWEDWPVKGNVYDHFYVEFDYGDGVKGHASSRHTKNTSFRVGERAVGSKGIAHTSGRIEGEDPFDYPGPFTNPRFIQWNSYIDSIRKGSPLNHGKEVTEASLCAILGRTSAYTGRTISYDWLLNRSQQDLVPQDLAFGPRPVDPVPVPGHTKLI